jgi:methyl-accepting chemotaxis protein WspA
MKNLTIRRRIVASFAVILALMMVMAAVAYNRLVRIEQLTSTIELDTLPGLDYSQLIVVDRMANYSLTQQYVLQTDMAMREKLRSAILESRVYAESLAEQYGATTSSPAENELFAAFKSGQDLYVAEQDKILTAGMDPKRREEVVKEINDELYPAFEKAQSAAGAVADFNKSEATESTQKIAQAVWRAKVGVLLSVGGGLIFAVVCGFFLLRAIIRPLGRLVSVLDLMRTGDLSARLSVDRGDEFGTLATGFNRMSDELAGLVGQVQQSGVQVNTSVTEIAATAKEQQATANEIASTTTEIGATSREITTTSRKLVATMHEVATVAEESAVLAAQGQTGLTHMEETMRRVMEAAGSLNEIQSAVAAGVMGMDKFSEEVRRGMQDVQQVGGQLSQVIQQVQALAPRVESVNEGMQAQATGAEQITQALAQLSEAAQQTVDSLRQSGLAIDELNEVAIGLRSGVSRFVLQAA